jgi:hypothetical protein
LESSPAANVVHQDGDKVCLPRLDFVEESQKSVSSIERKSTASFVLIYSNDLKIVLCCLFALGRLLMVSRIVLMFS